MKIKISACMIVKDEEKNIKRCIDSFKDVVNQIVVVDTGSTDNTVDIAKELGAEIYYFKWIDDFSAARNFALKKAKFDWIIFLDADEYFEEGMCSNLPNILKIIGNNLKIDCIYSQMINFDDITNQILDRVTVIRIFRNKDYIKYRKKIHECISRKNNELVMALTGYEDQLLIKHTGYSSANIEYKMQRNLDLLLSELETTKSKEDVYFYLVSTYRGLHDYDNAIKYATLYINSKKQMDSFLTYIPYLLILSMIEKGENYKSLCSEINKWINEFPNSQAFVCLGGMVNFEYKRYDNALKFFSKTIELRNNYKDREYYQEILPNETIFYNMAKIYEMKNEFDTAIDYYTKTLRQNKHYKAAFIKLIVNLKNKHIEKVLHILNSIYDISNSEDIRYIVFHLPIIKNCKVLVYYCGLLRDNFKQEALATIFESIVNENYNEAFNLLYMYSDKDSTYCHENLLVALSLLSRNTENINMLKDTVTEINKKIITCYCEYNENIVFNENEINPFIDMIKEFIYLRDAKEELERIIKIKNKFTSNISNYIGNTLKNSKLFHMALVEYEYFLNDSTIYDGEKINIFFDSAICSFNLLDYNRSLEQFENAKKAGYRSYDLYGFINWIIIKSDDEAIKQRGNNLLNNIFNNN